MQPACTQSISYKPFHAYLDHLTFYRQKMDLDFWPTTNKCQIKNFGCKESSLFIPTSEILERKFLDLMRVVIYFLADFFCDCLLLWKKSGLFADLSVMSGGLFSLLLSFVIYCFSANVTFTNSSDSWFKVIDVIVKFT